MAKKGESDEKVQAGTGPETLGKNVPGEPDQREAAALVAGGDPGAIEGKGAELPPGEPADAAGQSAGMVSDDQGKQDLAGVPAQGTEGDSALVDADNAGAARGPDGGADGGTDGMERLGAGAVDFADNGLAAALLAGDANAGQGGPEKLDGNLGADEGKVSDDDQNAAPVVPAGDPPAGEPDAQGTDQAAAGLAPVGEGHVEGGGDLAAGAPAAVTDLDDYLAKLRDDPAHAVAMGGFQAAYVAALAIAACGTEDVGDIGDVVRQTTAEALLDLAVFVRKIGRRATADVIGQQLKILGHRASPDLSAPERIAFAVFAHVLIELDAFAAAEAARIAAEKNPPAPAPPVPIDETTLEPVDDYFATWA